VLENPIRRLLMTPDRIEKRIVLNAFKAHEGGWAMQARLIAKYVSA
jgi:hypothetical protein